MTTASLTSSSASATSSADNAREFPRGVCLRPPPALLEGKRKEKDELARHGDRRIQCARHCFADASSRTSSHSSSPTPASLDTHQFQSRGHGNNGAAVAEHHHIIELEERLRRWRERALVVEGQALRAQRALQARYETAFSAAQATTETLTQDPIRRQRRLQEQLDLRKSIAPQTSGSERQESSSSSSTLMKTVSVTRSSSATNSGSHHAQEEQQLCRGNRRPMEKPPSTHHPPRRLAEARHPSKRAPLSERQWQQTRLDRSRSAAQAEDDAVMVHHNESHATLQANFSDVCCAVLGCMTLCSELRERHAALYQNFCGATHTTNDADAEERHSAHVTQALLDSLSHRQANDASSSLNLASLLPVLQRSLEHLNAILLSCVNDVALVHRRLDSNSSAASAPPSPQPRDAHRNTDFEELCQARAALSQEQQRHATVQLTLEGAIREMEDRAQAQQDEVSQMSAKARAAAEQAQLEYRRKLDRMRAALQRDIVEANQRASAAEHQCALHAQREAEWRRQLSGLTDERNRCLREDALLKGRLGLLQNACSTTAAQRPGSQQEMVKMAGFREQSDASAHRHSVTGLSRSKKEPTGGMTALKALVVNSSSPAPRATCSDTPLNWRTADSPSNGLAGRLSMPLSPSRSLSYCPPPSADKEQEHAWGAGTSHSAWAHDTRPTMGASKAKPDRLRPPSTLSSPPMDVLQPSVLATPEDGAYAGARALGHREGFDNGTPEQEDFVPWNAPPPPPPPSLQPRPTTEVDAVTVSSPLKSMRTWEEKFKSILSHR
ncbi:hypothetical protein JKF63_06122 [Porcisia hertigi]|uniref:Uncharacterized protein n=1 Tax=Porcisia hertigi TaxID=2761500 RepID=A0A836IZ58_9TRYP|nr:hypothetical protein JKF63_06122 [Porcisia hertigi]